MEQSVNLVQHSEKAGNGEKQSQSSVLPQKIIMKDLPKQNQPYECCLQKGPKYLTDAQLLAVIIRMGSRRENAVQLAETILDSRAKDGGIIKLMHLELKDLLKFYGVGQVKAVQMLCIGELSRRIWHQGKVAGIKSFCDPADVAAYCMEDMRHLEQEQVRALYLDTKQKLVGDLILSKGTVNSAVISPRDIYREALRCNSVSFVLIHNHPSGDPTPSKEDKQLTFRVKSAGEMLGISLLDHIIIGDTTYISFLNERLL